MQKLEMYTFFDKKSQRFDTPFFTYDEVGAKRNFHMQSRKKGSIINSFKNDFELYFLGTFDIVEGEINLLEVKKLVLEGKEIPENNGGDE